MGCVAYCKLTLFIIVMVLGSYPQSQSPLLLYQHQLSQGRTRAEDVAQPQQENVLSARSFTSPLTLLSLMFTHLLAVVIDGHKV